jgi:hypothetical protein
MKNKDLQAKVDAFIKTTKERKEKATDLDTLVAAISKLPYGQLKKVLTDDVLAVLAKYGYTE